MGFWLAVVAAYIIVNVVADVPRMSHIFLASTPVTMIILLVFNIIWGRKKLNVYIISGLIWSILISFVLGFIKINGNIWMILFIGIPAEIVAILSCRLGTINWKKIRTIKVKNKKNKTKK